MTRVISAALLTAFQDPSNIPVYLIRLRFSSADYSRTTHLHDLVLNGNTYTSSGSIIGMSSIRESRFLDAEPVVITYSGMDSTLLDVAFSEEYQGRRAEIHFGCLDSSGVLIDSPVLMFKGFVDTIEFVESSEVMTFTVTIESTLSDMNRARERFYTNEDQQKLFPGDLGLEFARDLEDKDITWKPHLGPQLWKNWRDPWGSHRIFRGGRITVAEPIAPRRYLYGEQKLGGIMVYGQIEGDIKYDSATLHTIIVLCDGPIQSIGNIYLNNQLVTFDDDGVAVDNIYEATTISFSSNTSTNIGTFFDTAAGFSILGLQADDTLGVDGFPPGPRIDLGKNGWWRAGNKINRWYKILSASADTITLRWYGSETEAAGPTINMRNRGGEYSAKLVVKKHLGSYQQAADATLIAALQDTTRDWTSAHRLQGIAYLYVAFSIDEKIFENGLPSITAQCEGFTNITNVSGVQEYTKNAALIIAHFLGLGGFPLGLNDAPVQDDGSIVIAATSTADLGSITDPVTSTSDLGAVTDPIGNVDSGVLSTAVTVSNELVPLNGGGTEKRYEINALIDSSQSPSVILKALRDAMAGDLLFSGGFWLVKAGKYVTPTITFQEDHFQGLIKGVTKRALGETFNLVRGEYVRADDNFTQDEYPTVRSQIRIDEVNSQELYATINYPHTTSAATAQRLAKMAIERNASHHSFTAILDLRAMELLPTDVINVNYSRFNYTDKPFEVQSWELLSLNEEGSPNFVIEVEFRELNATFDDWSSSEEVIPDPVKAVNFPPATFRQRMIRDKAALEDTENVFNLPQANLEVDDTQRFNAGGGTYNWFASDQNVFISIDRDITIPSMIQMVKGAQYLLNIEQDGTGGHSITFTGASWQFVGNIAPKLGQSAFEATQFVFMGVTVGGPNGPVKLRGVAQKFPA